MTPPSDCRPQLQGRTRGSVRLHADMLRILDANLNRMREALRVVEDYARFSLDDADSAAELKRCRHELAELRAAFGPDELRAARDTPGDIGRALKTPTELHRGDAGAIVSAAFARWQEAARVVGEYGKLVDGAAAAAAERLRYRAYELEPRIVLRGHMRQHLARARVYVLITAALCRGEWLASAEAALRGGADCLQLREKHLDDRALLARARALRELTRRHGALLALNDRPDLAKLAGADIVHVGQDDLSVAEVRRIAGGKLLVGKSTHTQPQVDAALLEEPDYLAVGPMWASSTKPQDHIAGAETLRYARSRTALPLVAIGGLTADNAASLWHAGATCLAVCQAVLAADDPAAAVRCLRAGAPAESHA